jgi:hypothetical protein
MCVCNDAVTVGTWEGEGLAGLDEDSGEACVGPRSAWNVSCDKRGCDGDLVKMGAGGYWFVK